MMYRHFEAFKVFFLLPISPLSIPNNIHCCQNNIPPALLWNPHLLENEKQVSLLQVTQVCDPLPPSHTHTYTHTTSIQPLQTQPLPHTGHSPFQHPVSDKQCSTTSTRKHYKILAMHSGPTSRYIKSNLLDSRHFEASQYVWWICRQEKHRVKALYSLFSYLVKNLPNLP